MKKTIAILLSAALILGLLGGCGTQKDPYTPTGNGLSATAPNHSPADPGTDEAPEISLIYEPEESLNPFDSMSDANRVLFSLIYQGLFAVDRNYTVTPILCQSYNVSADMRTYTFHLCQAFFSDGTAVTAEDVAASLNAARNSAWYGSRLQHLVSVGAYGDAVVAELDTPMENLPILLDIPIVKAAQVRDGTPLGTGPYRLEGAQLKRVAGWWCDAQLCISGDTIPLTASGTPAQNRDRFEQGDVSLVITDPGKANFVDFHSDYELWECENGLFLYLACSEDSEIFSNDTVRAALTHGIDRDSLTERFYQGFARSAQLPCSPLAPWYDSELAVNYGYDPEQLRSALEKEGYLDREIVLLLNGDDTNRYRVGQAIAAMLTECGLQVTLLESTTADFAAALKATDTYDLYLAQTRLSANMDLSAFFAPEGALNHGGLSDPGIYAMSLEALANAGNYYDLFEMVMDDGLLCPILFQSNAVFSQRGDLSALTPARGNLFYYDLGRTMADALLKE